LDQFGTSSGVVTYPIAFAVPVQKKCGRAVFPILNEKTHLVLCKITPKAFQKTCQAKDQFKTLECTISVRLLLAVPTVKRRWALAG
jgi:hypothetical protein